MRVQRAGRPLVTIAAATVAAGCAGPGGPSPADTFTYTLPSPPGAVYEIADTLVVEANSPLGAMGVVSGATVTMGLAFATDPGGVRVTGTVESLEASMDNPIGGTETADLDDVSGTLDVLIGRYGVVDVASFPEVSGALAPMSSFAVLAHLLFPRLTPGVPDPGATWTDTVTSSFEGEVGLTSTTASTYTFVGDTVVDGLSLLHIGVASEVTIELEVEEQGASFSQTLTGSAHGFALWDPARRLVAYGRFDRDLEGDVTMPGMPTIPVGITGPTVVRLSS